MNDWLDETSMPRRRDGVTIPVIGIAIALSVLLHVALLWQWKLQPHKPTPDKDTTPPLSVKLEPLPGPPPAVAMRTPPPQRPPAIPAAPAAPDARAAAPPPRPPPGAPAPVIALPAPAEPTAPAPVPAPPAVDFSAFIESQRRARGESASATPQPAEDDNARATRQAVANLSAPKVALGHDPTRSGGVFQVKRRAVDYAEFTFNGWYSEARRNWAQDITVRKGNHATIELAVVREMIEIIRKYEQADFPWYSYRLRRTVTRSARLRDSAELEEFLMQEFFFNPRVAP